MSPQKAADTCCTDIMEVLRRILKACTGWLTPILMRACGCSCVRCGNKQSDVPTRSQRGSSNGGKNSTRNKHHFVNFNAVILTHSLTKADLDLTVGQESLKLLVHAAGEDLRFLSRDHSGRFPELRSIHLESRSPGIDSPVMAAATDLVALGSASVSPCPPPTPEGIKDQTHRHRHTRFEYAQRDETLSKSRRNPSLCQNNQKEPKDRKNQNPRKRPKQ